MKLLIVPDKVGDAEPSAPGMSVVAICAATGAIAAPAFVARESLKQCWKQADAARGVPRRTICAGLARAIP